MKIYNVASIRIFFFQTTNLEILKLEIKIFVIVIKHTHVSDTHVLATSVYFNMNFTTAAKSI